MRTPPVRGESPLLGALRCFTIKVLFNFAGYTAGHQIHTSCHPRLQSISKLMEWNSSYGTYRAYYLFILSFPYGGSFSKSSIESFFFYKMNKPEEFFSKVTERFNTPLHSAVKGSIATTQIRPNSTPLALKWIHVRFSSIFSNHPFFFFFLTSQRGNPLNGNVKNKTIPEWMLL